MITGRPAWHQQHVHSHAAQALTMGPAQDSGWARGQQVESPATAAVGNRRTWPPLSRLKWEQQSELLPKTSAL